MGLHGQLNLIIWLVFASVSLAARLSSVQIHIKHVSPPPASASSTPYAIVNFDPTNKTHASVSSYTPPKTAFPSDSLIQIGIYDTNSASIQTSVAINGATFDPDTARLLTLYLANSGQVLGLGLSSGSIGDGKKGDAPEVRLEYPAKGPVPALDKPVQLNEDGQLPEVEDKRSFLQKYWWVFLGVTVFLLASGGPEK